MPGVDPTSPVEAIVARQLEAYNRQDVDTFVACFSPEVKIVTEGSDRQLVGRENMRSIYAAMFLKFPENHCALLSRLVIGKHVVDEELITGRNEAPFRTAVVYTIEDGLIAHARFLSRATVK